MAELPQWVFLTIVLKQNKSNSFGKMQVNYFIIERGVKHLLDYFPYPIRSLFFIFYQDLTKNFT